MAILIVDDDPVQCRLLEGMLQKFGYEAVTLDNGDAALSMLAGADGGRGHLAGLRQPGARPARRFPTVAGLHDGAHQRPVRRRNVPERVRPVQLGRQARRDRVPVAATGRQPVSHELRRVSHRLVVPRGHPGCGPACDRRVRPSAEPAGVRSDDIIVDDLHRRLAHHGAATRRGSDRPVHRHLRPGPAGLLHRRRR